MDSSNRYLNLLPIELSPNDGCGLDYVRRLVRSGPEGRAYRPRTNRQTHRYKCQDE